MGLRGPSDIVDRSLTPGKDWMYFLWPMSAEPISSLYESACQKLPASSPQYTPSTLSLEETQIAMQCQCWWCWQTMVKPIRRHWSTAKRSSPMTSLNGGGLSVCFQNPRVCSQIRRWQNRQASVICHHITVATKAVTGEFPCPWFVTASDLLWFAHCCMLWTTIPIAVSTVSSGYAQPYVRINSGELIRENWRARAMFK